MASKKVEDLALVSGVGATKLEQFRTEICVGRRKPFNGSYTLSTQIQNHQDDSRNGSKHCTLYRDRKGPFKTLGDLSKVKGLPPDRLAIVKMYLTTDSTCKRPGILVFKKSLTILENGFSIVAVQEIASREALSLIASELNEPKLYSVQSWQGERGKWHSLVPSHTSGDNFLVNGFLYDTSRGLQLQESAVLYIPPEKLSGLTVTCQPFFGVFKVKNLDFVVVTFSLVSETCVAKLLPSILDQLKEKFKERKIFFL
ncbi:hypothetical protein CEXT_538361 [Caerostris extrusa]|uniref:Uncharacterized protein n=1 Tax=Caerostris extrusa TaxID=172846 RepID=A0AAV4SI23_CAEEX|nr:hypothetical protein CEXT_538361 [Caerostris extrusa]